MLVDGARHRSQYRVHAPPRPLIVDSRRRRHTPCAISAESHRTCDDRSPTRRRTWRRKQNGIQRSKENQWPPQTRSSDSPRGPTQPSRSGRRRSNTPPSTLGRMRSLSTLPYRGVRSRPTPPTRRPSAVDRLSDQGFAVRRSAIVGRGLRSVEQVTGRMTPGRAALTGAGEGALIGLLFALLFGIFFTGPGFAELVLYSVVVGAVFAAPLGAIGQYVQRRAGATSSRPRASRRSGTSWRSRRTPPTRRRGYSRRCPRSADSAKTACRQGGRRKPSEGIHSNVGGALAPRTFLPCKRPRP